MWLQELKEASLLVLYSNLYETKFPLIIGVHKIGTICELVMLNVIIKGNIADISLELSERVFDEWTTDRKPRSNALYLICEFIFNAHLRGNEKLRPSLWTSVILVVVVVVAVV